MLGSVKRVIASGDAGATVNAAHTTVTSAGKDLVGLVASTGSSLAHIAVASQNITYIVVKCGRAR